VYQFVYIHHYSLDLLLCIFLQTRQNMTTKCDLSSSVYSTETNTTQKYHLIRERKTWQKAQSYCRDKHTDLVSGLKQLQDGELKEVMKEVVESVGEIIRMYFGLFRDSWRWSDGSSFSFRHWNNELNNIQYNSGLCAVTGFDDEGRWKTDSCDVKKPFIFVMEAASQR
uniref:C-type lectin domain-containing protein n=1 Tax=Fundulus heteroclitus TaxID=8078 RepID=A0A3Q2PVH1_FUNHE